LYRTLLKIVTVIAAQAAIVWNSSDCGSVIAGYDPQPQWQNELL